MNEEMIQDGYDTKPIFCGYQLEPDKLCWFPRGGRPHFDYSDGDEVERRIFEAVRSANELGSVSSELVRHITDWPTHYHFSPLRGNLLRPFKHLFRGRVLEVGAGCGAITRFLGECGGEIVALEGSPIRAATTAARCRDLPNVNVIVDAFDKFPSHPLFDVVTLIGVLEYARKYFPSQNGDPVDALLRYAQKFLKPDGVLVVAIENQLGLKYFAGSAEDHVGVSMYGIEDRYNDASVVTFGKQELSTRLERAGLTVQDWWLPFPDYKLPTVVVSEEGLKGTIGYQLDALLGPTLEADAQLPRSPLFMLERVWKPVVRNGLGADLANSFLVFAGMHGVSANNERKDVAYHFAVERRPEFAKSVVFSVDANSRLTTRQEPIFPGSREESRLPIRIRHDIKAPFIEGRLWSQELKKILTNDGWTQSEFAAWARCWFAALLEHAELQNAETQLANTHLVPGSLLDAVPRNLIVTPTGKSVFFDQEFSIQLPLELGFMVFRGIYLSLLSVGKVAPPSVGTPINGVTLFKDATQALGLWITEADLSRYSAFESDIQAWVSGRTAMRLDDVLAFSLDVRPPLDMHRARDEQLADAINERLRVERENTELRTQLDGSTTLSQRLEAELGDLASERLRVERENTELRTQLDGSTTLSQRLEAELGDLASERLRVERENTELRTQLTIMSNWAADIDKHSLKHAFKKTALGIARGTLRSMPVSIATKQRLRDVFFSTIRPLRQSVRRKSVQVRPADEAAPPRSQRPSAGVARDVFVFAVIDWHFRIQRPQHIARSLAESGHRVFYFSNHFVDADEPGYQLERIPGADALYQVKLHVKGAPAIYFDPPSDQALAMLTRSIAKVIQDFSALSSLSIVQHAYWYPLVKRLPNSYRIYDCMDHHEGFGNVPAKLVEIEKEMLCSADLVTVTSSWLEDFARKHNPSVALVRNAAEYRHFVTRPEQVYKDGKGRRIIGYYGAIAEWFDIDLVRTIALEHPDCLILLVGNDTVGAQKVLADLPNVEFTGEVPYATLPFYLHAFDVCLLPFKVIPLTLATNPVKVYEYLAAGKPVVCVDLPEVGQFGDLVSRACSTDDFVALVGASLQESGVLAEQKSAERRRFASEQTWCHRGAELATALKAVRMPRVSVIILTFNNLDLTRACLDSVLERSDYPNLEVIVVDNASSDGTSAYLEDFARRHPDVRVVLNRENLGFAAGNNVGLSIATGDYLVVLNNDTVVTQGWVMTLLRHFQNDPSLGIVGPVTNNIGNEARIETRYQSIAEMPGEALRYTLANMGKTYPMRTAAFFCVMFPRSVYELCGPICEDYGRGFFEDDDYCRRVESIGKRVVCVDDVFIHHHLSASFNKLKDSERQELFRQNKEVYEKKWGAWVPHSYRNY